MDSKTETVSDNLYLFFESVWKLHIGEIPEKPRLQPHYLGTTYGGHRFKILTDEYNEAIAAIKQNALTVGNPEILKQFGYLELPINGDFFKWPGGYETKEMQYRVRITDGKAGYTPVTTVAILTLPEEKKNTMENMTKEQQFNLPPAAVFNLQQIALADDDMVKAPGAAEKYRFIARHILELFTASGSVAAPKEEDEVSKLMAYKIQAYEQLAELTSLRQQLETLRGFVKEVDASLYHGPDLEDKEIMQHYIEVFKIIKEEARKLISK